MILPTALATCKLIQQLPTLLRQQCCVLLRPYCSGVQTVQQLPTSDATCNIQQCCVRLHEALLTIGRRRRRQRERQKSYRLDKQKTTTLYVLPGFFVHFFAVTARVQGRGD